MYIANCPFNKMKILSKATIGLEKSFPMMYSNIGQDKNTRTLIF